MLAAEYAVIWAAEYAEYAEYVLTLRKRVAPLTCQSSRARSRTRLFS
jgi:hypothetical protein